MSNGNMPQCPSFQEGMEAVNQQMMANPDPANLDAIIAVPRQHRYFWVGKCFGQFLETLKFISNMMLILPPHDYNIKTDAHPRN